MRAWITEPSCNDSLQKALPWQLRPRHRRSMPLFMLMAGLGDVGVALTGELSMGTAATIERQADKAARVFAKSMVKLDESPELVGIAR